MAILWPGKLRKGSGAAERGGRTQQCVPWLTACETLTFSCSALQTTAHPPQQNHLSAATSDPLWRAVRKGTAPAFSPQNMRCPSLQIPLAGKIGQASALLADYALQNHAAQRKCGRACFFLLPFTL